MSDALTKFENHKTSIRGLAYRMLGSRSEADDVVQDTWLRWQAVDHARVDDASRYLTRIASNLCLDRLNSARARREVYVGSWLPEPVVDAASLYQAPPDSTGELAEDLSFALMLALERLSPAERAAFLLHDVFGYGFDELGEILERSPAACRQLASRARVHVRTDQPRFKCPPDQARELVTAFGAAVRDGDLDALTGLLASDATFISDGGGQVTAVPKPLSGREKIAKAIMGFARLYHDRTDITVRFAEVNGLGGFVMAEDDGRVIQTVAFEPNANGEVNTIYVVRNPDKLTAVSGA